MNKGKVLADMITPLDYRIASVDKFMREFAPSQLETRTIPIFDPFGPTITESQIDALVLSTETLSGGHASKKCTFNLFSQ